MLRLNPDCIISREEIDEHNDCFIVDDFLLNPDALVDEARTRQAEFSSPPSGFFPGITIPVEAEGIETIKGFIRDQFGQIFGLSGDDVRHVATLQMTTQPPENLAWYQRLPHCDPGSLKGRRCYAAIIYLFDNPALGGTAFYRLRRPDLMRQALQLAESKPEAVDSFLKERSDVFRQPPKYLAESNDMVELLLMVPARFNRLVFYFGGGVPHSAYIQAPEFLTENSETGRLMLGMFYAAWPSAGPMGDGGA